MEKLLTVNDVADILQVSRRSAYLYIREMPHMQSPLRVTETALRGWIWERTRVPGEKPKQQSAVKRTAMSMADYRIPRRRERA